MTLGRKRWAIGEGYLPGWSSGTEPELQSQSDEPIVVQHTRLDSRASANALLGTVAYAADE